MQIPLNISADGVELSDQHRSAIGRRAAKLETLYDRITSCRVAVEAAHKTSDGQPAAYAVRVDLTVPRSELVVDQQDADSIPTAIDQAFDAAERRLRDFVERRRGR